MIRSILSTLLFCAVLSALWTAGALLAPGAPDVEVLMFGVAVPGFIFLAYVFVVVTNPRSRAVAR